MTAAQLRPFLWIAYAGVVTTALNTGISALGLGENIAAWRDVILLFHAPATFFPVAAIALLGFRHSPIASAVAIACTFLEKSVEFVGQTLLVFPPEEGGVAASAAAVWDQLFFVLWCCNTAGATTAGVLMLRLLGGPAGWAAFAVSVGAALLTALLVLGRDYVGLAVPVPGALLFFVIFTLYRAALAVTLGSAVRGRVVERQADAH